MVTNPVSSRSIDFGFIYFYRFVSGFSVLWFLLPRNLSKPSDFFLFSYGLFVIGPFVVFGFSKEHHLLAYHLGLIVIGLPAVVLKFVLIFKFRLTNIRLLPAEVALWSLFFITIGILFYSLSIAPSSAGFSLEDSYLRRLEGRETYASGTLIAYLIGTLNNGIAPYLAFVAGERKSRISFMMAFSIAVVYFYLVGLKAQFAYIVVAFLFGRLLRSGSLDTLPKGAVLSCICLLAIVIFEWLLGGGYSLIAELTFRRVNVIPGQVANHYVELIASDGPWTIWSGVSHAKGVSFLIGELHYTSETNANTSSFLYSFAQGGFLGLLFTLVILLLFYGVIDSIYRKTKNPDFLFLGFFYAIIITEQAATTALLSSGFAFMFLVLFFSARRVAPAN